MQRIWKGQGERNAEKPKFLNIGEKKFIRIPDLKEMAFTVDYTTSINRHDSIWGGFKII